MTRLNGHARATHAGAMNHIATLRRIHGANPQYLRTLIESIRWYRLSR